MPETSAKAVSPEISISRLNNRFDPSPKKETLTWSGLTDLLYDVRITSCTITSCTYKDCHYKNGIAWSPAIYPQNAGRKKANVEAVTALVVDLDHLTDKALAAARARLSQYRLIIHSTHSDRIDIPGERCVRVVIALSEPVSGEDWPIFWGAAMRELNQPADPACCDSSRLYYLPSRPNGAYFYFVAQAGVDLDSKAILSKAKKDDKDYKSTINSKFHQENGKYGQGQRHGWLKSQAGRLRYFGANPEGLRAALLELNKHCCNPPKPDEEVIKLADWASNQPTTTLPSRDNLGGVVEVSGNRVGLPVRDHQGNIELALHRLGIKVRYNEFSGYKIIEGLPGFGPRLDDPAMDHLWLLLDQKYSFRPEKSFFRDVIGNMSRAGRFHPVLDYLDGLKWDGKPRIDRWLVDYASAEESPYVLHVSRLILLAAVRRVRAPGAKWDEMPILESEQGRNKSTALRIMAVRDEWFSDDLPLGTDTKRALESTMGRWIMEAGELKGMSKGDEAALKNYLSRQSDNARMAYGRENMEVPRQFVVIGTTNQFEGYLKDPTGNRRFWPIRIQNFDINRLLADRDQLWAEASVAEATGESIRMNPDLYAAAAEEQEKRKEPDPIEVRLTEKLRGMVGRIKLDNVIKLLGNDIKIPNMVGRVGTAMKNLGWINDRREVGGIKTPFYLKGSTHERKQELLVNMFGELDVCTRQNS